MMMVARETRMVARETRIGLMVMVAPLRAEALLRMIGGMMMMMVMTQRLEGGAMMQERQSLRGE